MVRIRAQEVKPDGFGLFLPHWSSKKTYPLTEFIGSPAASRCQPDDDSAVPQPAEDGIVSENTQDFAKARTGEETELVVGIKNNDVPRHSYFSLIPFAYESSLNIIGIRGSIDLPNDHRLLVQNLTGQGFNNASVPTSAQASSPHIFTCQQVPRCAVLNGPGNFDLVGTVFYEIDQQSYKLSSAMSHSSLASSEFPYLCSVYGFRGVYRAYPSEPIHTLVYVQKTKRTPSLELEMIKDLIQELSPSFIECSIRCHESRSLE
ncbi:hypothetical protein SAY87_007918 [Trapa incisa]|uniref:Uncharacterized protein n=1 Tax=Trapa incisa TaxID=236973 RepID=A0AAN7QFG0_9MYRT|nr:hypothetical protein SAY87_007918 [Trapa incisa]